MAKDPQQKQPPPAAAGPQRVRVFIADHTGNTRREARLASDVQLQQLLPALITALGLPATDPAGRPVTYHLAFGERQLQEDETLNSAGVVEGADVTVVPEMTAGRGGCRTCPHLLP